MSYFVPSVGWAAPIVGAVVLGVAAPASASVIYVYTGHPFTQAGRQGPTQPPDPHTTSDRVAAVVELVSVLGPNLADQGVTRVWVSLLDGVSTLTGANATGSSFRLPRTAVPEPTSLAPLGLGLAGLAARRRRLH